VLITRLPELRLVLVTRAALGSSKAVIHVAVQPAATMDDSSNTQQVQTASDTAPNPHTFTDKCTNKGGLPPQQHPRHVGRTLVTLLRRTKAMHKSCKQITAALSQRT
jgi:hypothetical protein